MTDHLNYFCPYENQRPDSENALTRAFLALLRLSPTVHEAFLEEIRAQQRSLGMNENVLPLLAEIWSDDASIRTQKAFVGQETGRLLVTVHALDFAAVRSASPTDFSGHSARNRLS